MLGLEDRVVPNGTWTQVASAPSDLYSLRLLTNGNVLALTGGNASGDQWGILSPDSAGSYALGTFTAAASSNVPRAYFTSNVLPNGEVLIIGSELGGDSTSGSPNTGELYSPASNTWTPITSSPGGFYFFSGPTELLPGNSNYPDGIVLAGQPIGDATYVFNPDYIGSDGVGSRGTTGAKTAGAAGSYGGGEASAEEGWVLLPDNSVLSANTWTNAPGEALTAMRYFSASNDSTRDTWQDASHWDPNNPPSPIGTYDPTPPPHTEIGAPMLLTDGQVLWLGANGNTAIYNPAGTYTDTVTISGTPTATKEFGIWSQGPPLPDGLDGDELPAAELPDGKVLLPEVFSGPNGYYVDEYDPNAGPGPNGAFIEVPTNNGPGTVGPGASMVDLPNGHVLVSIGTGLWDFDPGISQTAISDSWRPQIQVAPSETSTPGTFILSGYRLTGMSEGATEGDDEEMTSNYPIVKLQLGNNVWYPNTHDWTPGVQDNNLRSVEFDFPPGVSPSATYTLTVVANGIPSDPISFTPYPGAIYADSSWANDPNGTVVPADPLIPGLMRTIGTNAFAKVDDAIGAAPAGGWVVVNGASTSGVFHETVADNNSVRVYLQNGPVSFDGLSGPAGGEIDLGGSVLTTGGGNSAFAELDSPIEGVGGVNKVGTGTFDLTGTNTFTGINGSAAITIDQGTLEVGSDAALGALTSPTAFDGGALEADADFTSGREIRLQTGGGTVNTNGQNVTFSGLFSQDPGGLTVAGAGSLTITGADNAAGLTEVTAGATLSVAGVGSSVGVQNVSLGLIVDFGGTLLGSSGGQIKEPVTVADTIEGGTTTSTGTALVVAALTFTPTGTMAARLNGPAAYDQILTTSSFSSLTNATLALSPGYDVPSGTSFTVYGSLGGPVNTMFANLPMNGSVISVGGQSFVVSGYGTSNVILTALPSVASVQVNDGSAQRSEVTSITVTFNGLVSFAGGNATAAFQLLRLNDAKGDTLADAINLSTAVSTNASDQTVVTITFLPTTTNGVDDTDPVSALNGGKLSLADGRYQLTIMGVDVTDANNGNLLNGGSNYISPADTQGSGPGELGLFRLFGDANGDGIVDQTDLGASRGAFNSSIGSAEYLYYFDADNSGYVDQVDLGQFRERFNTNVF